DPPVAAHRRPGCAPEGGASARRGADSRQRSGPDSGPRSGAPAPRLGLREQLNVAGMKIHTDVLPAVCGKTRAGAEWSVGPVRPSRLAGGAVLRGARAR